MHKTQFYFGILDPFRLGTIRYLLKIKNRMCQLNVLLPRLFSDHFSPSLVLFRILVLVLALAVATVYTRIIFCSILALVIFGFSISVQTSRKIEVNGK